MFGLITMPQVGPVEEHLPRKADTTPQRLDQMHLPTEPVSLGPPEVKPVRLNPNVSVSLALSPDGALQSSPGSAHPVTIGLNKEGIGNGFPNFQVQNAPPDTSGAVGRTQFVQWVNTSFAIFDKATGNRLLGPIKGKFLWQGLGGSPTTKVPCEETNDGDPIVSYDRVANRWVLSQFSVNGGVFAQCIAVSETSDALGKYHRYEYESPAFNDYPHMGVWRDAYYFSYNMFEGLSGSRACAYERRKMLAGNPGAKEQCIQLQPQFFGIQPSDTDGRRFAPVGRPNYFVGLGTAPNTLLLWKFHVDFANKNNTTMGVGPTRQPDAVIPVARYNLACSGTGGTCLPQPGTSRQLDSLGERLMFRLAYRKFATSEALVLNHSVDIGPPTGRTAVRWYEIRNPNAPQPTVFQQGTFSPDATHRWMGSIAMDKMGNIAVAYNITGNGQKPGVAFTARAPNDPPGIMGVETVIKAGGGIQDTSSTHLSRWGDYSGLTVDPVDDCTFWFTTEFQGANGVFNWRTSIAKFKLNSCH
ncbi:MAG TPA: hypothetical protein DC047_04510 [Blastocatellia bacterium]|nr:hypothetical protein [Blastocatellia bacterium]